MNGHHTYPRLVGPIALAAALLSAACREDAPTTPPVAATWADSAFGHDAVDWVTDDTSGGWTMTPELDETHVYFERDGSELIALDRATGASKWSGSIIAAENAAVSGDVVGAIWGGLEVFHRTTGAPRYTFIYPGPSLSGNVATSAGRFHMMTHDGRAVAIDAADGSIEWDTDLAGGPGTIGFGVTVAGDAIIAVLKHFRQLGAPADVDTGIVAALDATTGAVRWRVAIDPDSVNSSAVVNPAVISGNNVIVTTQGHDVIAFDLATGARRWKVDAAFGSPTVGSSGLTSCDGRVIVATGDLGVVSLNAATGVVQWKRGDLEQGSLRHLRCSHGTVLVLGSMLVLDASTGATEAAYPILDPSSFERLFWITNATRDAEWIYVATTRGYARFRAP